LEVALFLVVQFVLLLIQGVALRRHRHRQRSFQLLFSSTGCGIGLLIANSSVQIFAPTGDLIFWLYLLGFFFGVASAFLALAGFVLLFRDYPHVPRAGSLSLGPSTKVRNAGAD
jgi:hypothetical protein